MAEIPIFSPSRGGTQDFMRCPRLYDLKKRWEPYETWKPEMAMGTAIHAGLATAYTEGVYENAVFETLERLWYKDFPGEMTREVAKELCRKVLKEALKIDLLGTTGSVLAVEKEMGPEECHPDLVIKHKYLQVTDWKFSLTGKPEWVASRLASYQVLWQLYHYAWRVQQEYGIPCTSIGVVQMYAYPKPMAREVFYDITQEALDLWHRDAVEWWKLMASGFKAHNPDGCRKYGENHLCPFYTGCWSLAADEEQFHTLYRRKA